jgi:hypothetical protein
MPQKHGAQMTKKQRNCEEKTKRAISVAVDDGEAFFGRVLKINQNRCTLHLWDHELERHIEVQGVLPNKKKAVIRINDIVNVAKSSPDWEVQVSIDRKTATRLRKTNRITDTILNDGSAGGAGGPAEDGFEFDYESAPQQHLEAPEVIKKPKKAAALATVEEEDVDVDNI